MKRPTLEPTLKMTSLNTHDNDIIDGALNKATDGKVVHSTFMLVTAFQALRMNDVLSEDETLVTTIESKNILPELDGKYIVTVRKAD